MESWNSPTDAAIISAGAPRGASHAMSATLNPVLAFSSHLSPQSQDTWIRDSSAPSALRVLTAIKPGTVGWGCTEYTTCAGNWPAEAHPSPSSIERYSTPWLPAYQVFG